MKSAIGALAEENTRLMEVFATMEQVIVDRDTLITSLRRELRDTRHERDYLQRKLDRITETS